MAPICQCGCGESLPENSTRAYKRGHKPGKDGQPVNEFTDTPPVSEPDNGEPAQPGEFLTIDQAAEQTPDDPEPADQQEAPKPKTPAIRITAALRRDVEGKLAFIMGLSGQMWAMGDPVCGAVFLTQTPEIAKKLTPIVCQSPDVVKWLTKTSNFTLWIDLFMACLPVMQMIFAHHIAKSVVADMAQQQNGQSRAPNDYVVQ